MVNSVVDPGSFDISGFVLHFIPPGFLPECPRSISKYPRKSLIPINLDFEFPEVSFVRSDQ